MSEDNDNPEMRAEVYSRIAPVIMAFYGKQRGKSFHVEELRQYVLDRVDQIAPDSPGRILRQLRLEGRLHYTVINRRQSLYLFDPPRPSLPPQPFESLRP